MNPVLRLGLLTLLVLWSVGCGRARDRSEADDPVDVGAATELNGTWFVRYRSLPTPFLDVSFSGREQPTEVRVDLQGPEQRFAGIKLAWNERDSEWQHPIAWLPDPLPQGLWWVAAVEARLPSGEVLNYSSPHPARSYTIKRRESSLAQPSPTRPTRILPGAFTAPPSTGALLRIETSPVEGHTTGDPILHAFEVGNPITWFAVNDDFEVNSPYPSLWLDPGDRTELLVRVSGQEDDQGTYQLHVLWGPQSGPPKLEGRPDEDQFEVGDSPSTARPIRPGEARIRRLSSSPTGQADEDWFRIMLPAK
jgi:hypothetical protein